MIECSDYRLYSPDSNTLERNTYMQKISKYLGTFALTCTLLLSSSGAVFASIPDVVLYEGRLLDSAGDPIVSSMTFRFSLWSSSDFTGADLTGAGAIEITAPSYSGWQEEHTFTPTSLGTFSRELGSVTPLPNVDFTIHKFLQVEIKNSGDADTDYQLMDPTGDDGGDADDRKTIGSIPYAIHAEDAHQTAQDAFLLDADDSAGSGDVIQLQFGDTLGKFLEYDITGGYFRFNDDVLISGDLTVTGLINGVDITSLPGGHTQNTDTGTDADTFEINDDGNGATLDTTGLTGDITVSFDDADTTVVGEDNTQTLTNKTIDGDDNTITDIDISSLKDRDKTILLAPEYNNITLHQDGSDNRASLYQGVDTVSDQQYYSLTSQEATLQDLDLHIIVPIPDDFVSFQATPLQIYVYTDTTDSSENQVDVFVDDSVGTAVALVGGADLTSALAGIWTEYAITFGGVPTFTPGGFLTLQLKMQSHSSNVIRVGRTQLNYIGK